MALYHSPRIVTDGLVLCLDAANVRSYPGSGTSWFDLSGNGYTQTLSGGAGLTTQDGVACIDCTGAKTTVDAGTTFSLASSHTLISWARPLSDAQTSTWRTLWRTQPDDHPLLIQDSTNTIGYYDNNGGAFVSYGLNLGTLGLENVWTMFSLMASGGTTTLYINDGSTSGSVSYTASGNSHDALGSTANGSQAFGYIGTAQVYNRALSVSEISQNFNATRNRFGV
jgi:hypothetical protein